MNEDIPLSPYVHEGLDPVPQPRSAMSSTMSQLSDAVKETTELIGDAIEAGRKPGRPLSILTNVAREAPLASLLAAFLLGFAVARRRR